MPDPVWLDQDESESIRKALALRAELLSGGARNPLADVARDCEYQLTLRVLVRFEARTLKGRSGRSGSAGPDVPSANDLQGHVPFCPADGGRSGGACGDGRGVGDAGAGGCVQTSGGGAEIPPSARAGLSPAPHGSDRPPGDVHLDE